VSSQLVSDFSWDESRGVAVLAKCVNPVCSNQFRFLHQGKLFEVEIQYIMSQAASEHRGLGNAKGHVERYWLCNRCAQSVTLRFVKHQGLLMYSPLNLEEVAIPLSGGRTVAEVSQVRIRPLDLNADVRRDSAGGSEVRRQAA